MRHAKTVWTCFRKTSIHLSVCLSVCIECTYLHLTSFLSLWWWVSIGALPHSGESGWFFFWKEADSSWQGAWQWAVALLFAPQEVDVLRVEVNRRISLFFFFFYLVRNSCVMALGGGGLWKKVRQWRGDGPLSRNCLIKPSETAGCMGTRAKWVAGSCARVLPHE